MLSTHRGRYDHPGLCPVGLNAIPITRARVYFSRPSDSQTANTSSPILNFGGGKLGATGIKGDLAAAEEPTRNLRRDLNFFLKAIMGIISNFLGSESRRCQLAVVWRDFKTSCDRASHSFQLALEYETRLSLVGSPRPCVRHVAAVRPCD